MEDLYPTGPASVPPDLTRPTASYKRHAYLAVAGLLTFVAAYLALAGWFAWTAYRLIGGVVRAPEHGVAMAVGAAGAAFLAVFMLKALIPARRTRDPEREHEITAADHPRLFAFLHRLADEAGAPRPHRVFLSARVNAAVFYELTVANLFFPSKKNLEIGLGLVNVLTLGELKAVLAHEFGHFAQRTMAVGRWVYTAQQIAAHIVAKRDGLDHALHALSSFDVRVAWIGWLLRLVVWSIRSLVDTCFGWVVLAQRALSREMELQADLVSVSLAGSDAIVHALHRLEAADDALDRALAFTGGEMHAGRAVADLFAIQTHMLEQKRAILDDPTYGTVPTLPADAASHRVFEAQLAHPPRMWSTHPPSELREANAKRSYVRAPLDDRASWLLFRDPEAVRAQVTASLLAGSDKALAPVPIAGSLAAIDKAFARRYFDPAYRGVYLGRSAMQAAATVDELYAHGPVAVDALDDLYPPNLSAELTTLRELGQEKAALEALRKGVLEAPGRVVRFRGQDRKRKELPGLIAEVDRELAAARDRVAAHDRAVRVTHLEAARTLGGGWADYLRGLAAIVHYTHHAEADLDDAAGHVDNVVAVVTADGKLSDAEVHRLVRAATELYEALARVYGHAGDVVIGDRLAAALDVTSWRDDLEAFQLDPPQAATIGNWLDAAMTWGRAATTRLSALHDVALEELLRAEAEVAAATRAGTALVEAPPPPRVPRSYRTLLPGQERPRQERLGWWDRFQVADGFVPAAARFTVAGAIVGGVLLAAGLVSGEPKVIIYNGLGRTVAVEIAGTHVEVSPHWHTELDVEPGTHTIVARTTDGQLIESFRASADDELGRYVYNVARAAPLITMTYARDASDQGQPRYSTDRWFATSADRFHDELPSLVSGRGDSVSVMAMVGGDVRTMTQGLEEPERQRLAVAHARWEAPDGRDLAAWLDLVPDDAMEEVVAARLAADPDDVVARRKEQDIGGDEACHRQRARAGERPDDASWQYLAARCLPDGERRDAGLRQVIARFPDAPWSVYSQAVLDENAGRWSDAGDRYARALDLLPPLGEQLAVRLARARRAAAPEDEDAAAIGDLVPHAGILQLFLALEATTRPEEPAALPWWHLGMGRLAEAEAAADPRDTRFAMVLAASDGAPEALVKRALATPPRELPWHVQIYGYALAARRGQDPRPYLDRLGELDVHSLPATRFLEAVRDARTPEALAAAEAALGPIPIELRARLYAAAAVLLGDACPPAWRQLARRALFRTERPFLKAS